VHAYPFVTLHQSASFYGVNSRPLERTPGEYKYLSSKNDILAYYEAVRDDLLATGRVRFFPLSEADVDGPQPHQFKSLVTGAISVVSDSAKIVDATYTRGEIPSIHGARLRYSVAEDVNLVPINHLPSRAASVNWACYCIVGAGKTSMDAVIWLLNNGVAAEHIKWITPNDSWLHVREAVTPPFFLDQPFSTKALLDLADALYPTLDNMTHDSFVAALETAGIFARIDPSVEPTKYKGAVVSWSELEQLRGVRDTGGIVRHGRVQELMTTIDGTRVAFKNGTLELPKQTLFVDCSADGNRQLPVVPVFDGTKITLQAISSLLSGSATAIAHLEARPGPDAEKRRLTTVVISRAASGGSARRDIARMFYQDIVSKEAWKQDRKFSGWLASSRTFPEAHSIGRLKSIWEILKRPKTALRLVEMNQKFTPALRRVCIQEGGDC
jgi:hypothetical protein